MKGQFNIEYLVALALFIVLLVFISAQIAQAIPEFHTSSVSSSLDAKSYRITDSLIKTMGEPDDWEANPSTAKAIGLSAGEPYVLSEAKIASFNTLCGGDYNRVRDLFGLDPGSDFRFTITVGGAVQMDCGQRAPLNAIRTIARRYAATSAGSNAEIILSTW